MHRPGMFKSFSAHSSYSFCPTLVLHTDPHEMSVKTTSSFRSNSSPPILVPFDPKAKALEEAEMEQNISSEYFESRTEEMLFLISGSSSTEGPREFNQMSLALDRHVSDEPFSDISCDGTSATNDEATIFTFDMDSESSMDSTC